MLPVKKIGIDARFFGPKDKGFGRYVQNLISNLEIIDKKNHYFIFLNKKRDGEYFPKNQNFKKILVKHNRYWSVKIDKKFYQPDLDVIHFTCLPPPIFYKARSKMIFTLHDLTWRFFPVFKNPIKKFFYNLSFLNAVRNAALIIVPSKHTKKDVLRLYKIDPQRVKVIYEGVI